MLVSNRSQEQDIIFSSSFLIYDSDSRVCDTLQIQDGGIIFPDNVFGSWMTHSEPEVKLAGMFLSVHSSSITKTIPDGVFRSLRHNLSHFHTDTDTNFRREVHEHTEKILNRLRASTATLSRGQSKSLGPNHGRLSIAKSYSERKVSSIEHPQQGPLAEALAFIVWYLHFLECEMRPTASYQRCTTALRSVIIMLRSGVDPGVPHSHLSKSAQGQLKWVHGLHMATAKMIRVLFDQILDPFDDIRDAAISILHICLETLPQAQKDTVLSTIPRFISRAEKTMLQTGRADQADGVARAYGLIFSLATESQAGLPNTYFSSKLALFKYLANQLNNTLDVAQHNLLEAINGRPIHGTYAAIRYIVDQHDYYSSISKAGDETFGEWKQVHCDVLASMEPLWSIIYHTLCADAPEGYIPDGMEDEASLNTKEVSSYSWRGLKEARYAPIPHL